MKIRQAQTSATYILPDPGELNKRVLIRLRVDMPADNFGVEPQYPVTFRTWAKVIQTSATTRQETAQTGDAITHYITIRYRRGITADYEVVCGDSVYRVKRQRDLNGARRFLLLECTELGEFTQSHGGNNGDFLFHVDVQQPAEMRFNRARVRRAFVTIGQRHMRDARRLVMRRARSAPGENPGYQTGRLARSIGYMVPGASKKRAGFMTRIAPNQRNGKGNRMISGDFYPAFLFFGVRGGAKRRRSHHRGASGGSGWRLAPRNNFMVETLEKNRSWTRYFLARELRKSLKPERRHR